MIYVVHMAHELHWIAPAIRNLMQGNGIESNRQLAKFLKLGSTTINRAFAPDMTGKATSTVMAAMCQAFNVPMAAIVYEPATQAKAAAPDRRPQGRAPHSSQFPGYPAATPAKPAFAR